MSTTPSRRASTRPDLPDPISKRHANFARQAAIDAFGPKAVHHLNGADFEDRQPNGAFRPIGQVAAKITNDTGRKALRHWLNQAGRADSEEERAVALEIAGEIGRLMGIDIDLPELDAA